MFARANAPIAVGSTLGAIAICTAVVFLYPLHFPYEDLLNLLSYLTVASLLILTCCSSAVCSRRGNVFVVRRVAGSLTLFLGIVSALMFIRAMFTHVPDTWVSTDGQVAQIDYFRRSPISFSEYGTKLRVSYEYGGQHFVDEVFTTEFITPPGSAPKDWQTYRYQDETEKDIAKRKKWLAKVNKSFLQHTIYTDNDTVQLKVDPKDPSHAMLANWVFRYDFVSCLVDGLATIFLIIFGLVTLLTDKSMNIRGSAS